MDKLYCAPGSAGIRQQAEPVDIAAGEIEKLADFAAREAIDLTVVGPEQPLVLGISDLFESRGLKVFGPNRDAARIEGSKAFAKELMLENGIPTAACEVFSDLAEARKYVGRDQPCVVKADGSGRGQGRDPVLRTGPRPKPPSTTSWAERSSAGQANAWSSRNGSWARRPRSWP